MKSRIAVAAAIALGLAAAAAPAFAADAQFRTAAPQAFSAQDLQNYGLSADKAQDVLALQDKGYKVQIMSREEAQKYRAGLTDSTWLVLGAAAVVVIVVAAS
jgi:hypothetical protein